MRPQPNHAGEPVKRRPQDTSRTPALARSGGPGENGAVDTSLIVTEDADGLRALRFGQGGARQSLVRPGDPRQLELPYTRMSMVGLAFVPQPRRILVVGLGGGAVPMFLRAVVP